MAKLEDIKHETEDVCDHWERADELARRALLDPETGEWALRELSNQLVAMSDHLLRILDLASVDSNNAD